MERIVLEGQLIASQYEADYLPSAGPWIEWDVLSESRPQPQLLSDIFEKIGAGKQVRVTVEVME